MRPIRVCVQSFGLSLKSKVAERKRVTRRNRTAQRLAIKLMSGGKIEVRAAKKLSPASARQKKLM